MKKREAGQALILVLILLAIGATMVIPMLQFAFTASKGSQIVTQHQKDLYAAEGAQEYVAWSLKYGNLVSLLPVNGSNTTLTVNVCDTPVDLLIVMRAVPGRVSRLYASKYTVEPTKTVSPSTVPDGNIRTYTYTIKLENVTDNATTLDAVYDILPKDFGTGKYVANSANISQDGGTTWQSLGPPKEEIYSSQSRLLWPNTYNYSNKTGGFSSPIKDFARGQVKLISFQVTSTLTNNRIDYNWVVLMPNSVISLPQAPITVGGGGVPNGGFFVVQKTAAPQIIHPGIVQDIKYDISITNLQNKTDMIQTITDYLPPEFNYTTNTTSGGISTKNPTITLGTYNGVQRYRLVWSDSDGTIQNKSFSSGETKHLIFWARTTQEVSGTYFNEVDVSVNNWQDQNIFQTIGVTQSTSDAYSWNTGTVIVPSYDSSANTTSTTIWANMGITGTGVDIYSWQVR